MKILLIEDDHLLGQGLKDFLCNEGYACVWESNIADVKRIWLSADLVILDRHIFGEDSIRSLPTWLSIKAVPVIVLTALIDVEDRVAGLEAGARDYITKPFSHAELLARIRVQIRPLGEAIINVGELVLMPARRQVNWRGAEVPLTNKEFNLLFILAQMPGRVFTRDELLNQVWGYQNFPSTRTVDMHIVQLRRKMRAINISTVHGIGYRLEEGNENNHYY